jgi:hypothetical protein
MTLWLDNNAAETVVEYFVGINIIVAALVK